jgi:2,4-dienoyl-CoA reductase (NADPH2)
MWGDVEYLRIDDSGLHLRHKGEAMMLEVDNVVICAGQEPLRQLADELSARGQSVRVIGGADVAQELDARRAIAQATELALSV